MPKLTAAKIANRAKSRAPRSEEQWRLRRAGKLTVVECAALDFPWLIHGFSTRLGGASRLERWHGGRHTAETVLNLGFTDWDSRESVLENRRRWRKALHASDFDLIALKQFHSDAIRTVSVVSKPSNAAPWQGDALISGVPRRLLSVQTADCIPILLADSESRAVGAVHAGWRGTVKRIAAKTVGKMRMEFGARPENLVAALGPGIGACCYEVGPDVVKEFASQFADAKDWFDDIFEQLAYDDNPNPLPWLSMMPPGHERPLRTHLDLHAANRAILLAAGLRPENIFSCPYCVSCQPELFFSYRRERPTGRLMASIALR
jgi:hypothetical protein